MTSSNKSKIYRSQESDAAKARAATRAASSLTEILKRAPLRSSAHMRIVRLSLLIQLLVLCLFHLEYAESLSTPRGFSSSSSYGGPFSDDPGYASERDHWNSDHEDDEDEQQRLASPPSRAFNLPQQNQKQPGRPSDPLPPPPPPPPPRGDTRDRNSFASATAYEAPPIHYQFQSKDTRPPPLTATNRTPRQGRQSSRVDDDTVPWTSRLDEEEALLRNRRGRRKDEDDATPAFASARRDAITLFMDRSILNRWMVRLAAGMVGSASFTFVGASLTTKSWWSIYAWTGFWLCLVTSWFRSPYGELCRATGFLLLMTIRESRQIRRNYPTGPHVRALLGAGPRRPFPPADNPWNYRPSSPDDVTFNMLYCIMAMAAVGSFCGGNIPMLPSWLGALMGAGFLGLLTTRPTSRGDLARATGMRVVATIQTVWDLQRELMVTPKLFKVLSLLLDKLLILDRQHRLKDRLIVFLAAVYDQVMRLVQQVQQQQQQGQPLSRGSERGRKPPPVGRERRPQGRRSSLPKVDDDRKDSSGFEWSRRDQGQIEDEDDEDYLDGLAEPAPPDRDISRRRGRFW